LEWRPALFESHRSQPTSQRGRYRREKRVRDKEQPMLYGVALLAGIAAGSRTFVALAAASWAARLGYLGLGDSWLAFMGYAWTPWIFTLLALVEMVADQLPSTPSRKVPMQFGARIVSGALSGATLGVSGGSWIVGLIAGVIGAVIGTYGGAEIRALMAKAFGRDTPAAFIEDAGAIVLGLIVVAALR
jgi:uncharacterized membrane protein